MARPQPPAQPPPGTPTSSQNTQLTQAGSAFGQLLGSVIRVSSGIAGMTTIFSAAGNAIKAMGNGVKAVSGLFVMLVSPMTGFVMVLTGGLNGITNFVQAIGKAVTGLFMLGAAAAPQGIQTFAKVLDYLTSVIGSIATPVFLVITAAVLTVADALAGPMLAATEAVAKWMADNLVSAIKETVGFFVKLYDWGDYVIVKLQNFADYMLIVAKMIQLGFTLAMAGISKAVAYVLDFIPGLGDVSKALDAWSDASVQVSSDLVDEISGIVDGIDKRNDDQAARSADRKKSLEAGGGIDTTINGLLKGFGGNLGAVITEMRRGMAEKGNVGFSGLTDVQKTIQTQAFQSTISGRQLDTQIKILDILSGMAQRFDVNRPNNPAVVA